MESLVAELNSCGFQGDVYAGRLQAFDTFIRDNGFDDGTLSRTVIEAWEVQRPTENSNTRNDRVAVVRKLAEHMMSMGVEAFLPSRRASSEHPTPYIPTREELRIFFSHLDAQRSGNPMCLRIDIEYPVMFRLYYNCGLRLNEAVMLRCDDVRLDDGCLYIRHSKGDRDRKVFPSDDLVDLLARYDRKMDSQFIKDREWFFPGFFPEKPFSKTTLDGKFKEWWHGAFPGWQGKMPTIHSLRHAFVVHRMNGWVEAGNTLGTLMPYLSRHLGHSSIEETMYYYHQMDAHTGAFKDHIENCSIAGKETDNA
jgi:integrase